MIQRHKPLIAISFMLILAALSCSLGGRGASPLGETYQSDQGGFILQKVTEYEFEETFGMVLMKAPGADPDVGPFIMVYGGLMEEDLNSQDILDEMQTQAGDMKFNSTKKTKVDGIEGLLVEFSGIEEDQVVKGKLFVVAPRPLQEFYIVAIAPEERWKELEPTFNLVLKSVSFIDAQPFEFGFEDLDSIPDEDWEPTEEIVDPDDVFEAPMETVQVIRQWAVRAEASSEYSSDDYSAMQATGEPNVEACEENPLAWASEASDTEEYLILYFETPVNPTELIIYQSHNPSQVVEIQFIDTVGETWMLWDGDPYESQYCPDKWTHTIDLDEVFYADTVVIWVDQSILGLGWVEIDAVELVGYPLDGTSAAAPDQGEPAEPAQPTQPPVGDIPSNYSGLMAGPVYQGWINIVIGETMEADLDQIMTIPGKKSTDSWKPRESHKQTYLYEMPWDGMTGFISVTTEGWVYKMNVSSNTHPTDFALATVNRSVYDELNAIYNRDKVIPYEVMANLLESPGFLREQYYREEDEMLVSTYSWYNAAGDRMTGIFFNGRLTGMMGLNFIPAE